MPKSESATRTTNPRTPPEIVKSALRCPWIAPWVRASRPFGPGESDKPIEAARYENQVLNSMPHGGAREPTSSIRGDRLRCGAMTKPLDIETLWRLERVGAVTLSPDGSAAVCAVTSYSMEDNKGRTNLWLLPTRSTAPRRLTSAGEKDGHPAWSPRGDRIAFLAKRE